MLFGAEYNIVLWRAKEASEAQTEVMSSKLHGPGAASRTS